MPKVMIEYYQCDRCNAISDYEMTYVDTPALCNGNKEMRCMMVCKECYDEYWQLGATHFAEVTLVGSGQFLVQRKSPH